VPVVQPAIGAFPELLDATGGGILVAPENAGELVKAFERMMANPQEANEMGLYGKQAVYAKFHSRRLAEETVALYEKLLPGKSTAAEERVLSANQAR
jgi:glycosyltransferase involved in cell wall biosynthesis